MASLAKYINVNAENIDKIMSVEVANIGLINGIAFPAGGYYASAAEAAADGMITYWGMREGSGNPTDSIVSTGGGTLSLSNTSWTSSIPKFGSYCLSFTGTGVQSQYPEWLFSGKQSWTICTWAWRDSAVWGYIAAEPYIVGGHHNNGGMYFAWSAAGNLQAGTYGLYWDHASTGTITTTGSWVHIAHTKSSTQSIFYANGSPLASPMSTTYTVGAATYRGVGNSWTDGSAPNGSFTGKMQDFGFWTRALSPAEISNIYNTEVPLIA